MPSVDTIKMEDRKRSAIDALDSDGPPQKKHAPLVNGSANHPDADMPWKDDIQAFQKDAILREMQHYKRQVDDSESRVKALEKERSYHDEHLRILDAWFDNLLDQLGRTGSKFSSVRDSRDPAIPEEIFIADAGKFEEHLQQRSDKILSQLQDIMTRLRECPPTAEDLQSQLSQAISNQAKHCAELDRLQSEKKSLTERLETASMRYMMAEKKVDRAKSAQVARIEAQAFQAPKQNEPTAEIKREPRNSPAVSDTVPSAAHEAAEAARKKIQVVSEERAKQLDKLATENKRLTENLTAARIKASGTSDEDFAASALFQNYKLTYEDMVKRVNDIESINVKLREETQQLRAERAGFKEKTDEELRNQEIEMESRCARLEQDIARVRKERDSQAYERDNIRNDVEKQTTSYEQLRQLSESQSARIESLETELERFRADVAARPLDDVEGQSPEQLKARVQTLEQEKKLLDADLQSMEGAWKKASAAASKKLADTTALEARMNNALAARTKANQQGHTAVKNNSLLRDEVKTLKTQNAKSSEIMSKLKDSESNCRTLIVNLEKQLAEAKDSLTSISVKHRESQASTFRHKSNEERLTSQVASLEKLSVFKDTEVRKAQDTLRDAETKLAEANESLKEVTKELDAEKVKSQGDQNEEYKVMRSMVVCAVCNRNFKDTVIRTCGHVCCKACIDERYFNRSRKCPLCNKAFGKDDGMRIHL